MSLGGSRGRTVTLLGWMFLARLAVSGGLEPATLSEPKPCCYENTRYEGTCVVTPGPGESCASILEYLNTPNTVGKTYCSSSRIRGGWTSVDCAAPGQPHHPPH